MRGARLVVLSACQTGSQGSMTRISMCLWQHPSPANGKIEAYLSEMEFAPPHANDYFP